MQQTEELTQSYVTRINQIHAEGEFLGMRLKDLTIDILNKVREAGILMDAAKSELGNAGWASLQTQLNFGDQREQMVQTYLKTYLTFARKAPEPIKDVALGMKLFNEAMMVTGMRPFPQTFEGQKLIAPGFHSWIAKAMVNIRAELHKKLQRTPIESWRPAEAEQFVSTLRPYANDLNALIAKAEQVART